LSKDFWNFATRAALKAPQYAVLWDNRLTLTTGVFSRQRTSKPSRFNSTLPCIASRIICCYIYFHLRLRYPSWSVDKEGSELLFTHLSLRAGRKSTIITTNLSFERWEEIFKDPVMTAAMIDRLTHKSYIVNMNGNSYRLKETKMWLEEQE